MAEFEAAGETDAPFCLLPRIVAISFLMIATGCTTPGPVSPGQTSIDSNHSVIAFSVDNSEWTEEDVWLRPKQLLLRYDDESIPIPLGQQGSATDRVLIEIPANEISFDWYFLDSGAGIFWKQYLSAIGQSFQLTKGRVNYLGRIGIEEVEFESVDDEDRRQPVALKLAFADTLAEDLAAWRPNYKVFQDQMPEQQLVGQLSEPAYQPVWVDEFDSANPTMRRSNRPPVRKATPQRKPRKSRTRPTN